MIFNALKSETALAAAPFSFPWHPLWSNFTEAWIGIAKVFWLTGWVEGVSVLCTLAFSLLSGYMHPQISQGGFQNSKSTVYLG